MPDHVAGTARYMKVVEAIVAEFQRQGVALEMADLGFDVSKLAKAVIAAADGQVIPFPPRS
jgi:hypothetical protein